MQLSLRGFPWIFIKATHCHPPRLSDWLGYRLLTYLLFWPLSLSCLSEPDHLRSDLSRPLFNRRTFLIRLMKKGSFYGKNIRYWQAGSRARKSTWKPFYNPRRTYINTNSHETTNIEQVLHYCWREDAPSNKVVRGTLWHSWNKATYHHRVLYIIFISTCIPMIQWYIYLHMNHIMMRISCGSKFCRLFWAIIIFLSIILLTSTF